MLRDPTERSRVDTQGMDLPAYTTYFQFKGIFDMDELYQTVYDFFSNIKYKFYEKKFLTKHPGPFGFERYHYWWAERDIEEYFKFIITLFIRIYDEQDVLVTQKDGTQKEMKKGRLWIQFRGWVETDFEGRWSQNAFVQHLQNFYHKYVVFKKAEAVWWDNMYYNVYLKLQSVVKEKLNMESEGYENRYFNKVR